LNNSSSTNDSLGQTGEDKNQQETKSSDLPGTFDKATRTYTTDAATYHMVSFTVPEDLTVDYDGGGMVHVLAHDFSQQVLLFRLDEGNSNAKENFENYEKGVDDFSVGHYVTYGENKYYTNEGSPDSDGAVMYYLDGVEKPSLYWIIQVNDENEYMTEEILTSFRIVRYAK
jgi:hypothetical protein